MPAKRKNPVKKRSTPKKSARKKSAKKNNKGGFWRFVKKIILLSIVFGTIILSFYTLYLNNIIKDKFKVSVDFLKIESADIKPQTTVTVFNLESNRPQIKQYVSGSSASQSSPDNEILEIGRLNKRIAEVIEMDNFSLKAVSAKTSQPTIISLSLSTPSLSLIQTEPKETTHLENPTIEENNIPVINDSLIDFDFEVKDDLSSDSTTQLVIELKKFLNKHNKGVLSSSIDIALRSLNNEISKESLNSALQICQEIIKEL